MGRHGRRTDRPAVRLAAIAGGLAVLGAVGVIVFQRHDVDAQPLACAAGGPRTEVRGIIGSEKGPMFRDSRVLARFACHGLSVTVDSRGSLEMIAALTRPNHSGYDFAFPASTPTAARVMKQLDLIDHITPFTSPMAVATFTPVVYALTRSEPRIVHEASNGSMVVDVKALIEVARKGLRWDQLPGTPFPDVHNAVLLRTTDPQESNSGLMFLAIASNAANNGDVVTSEAQLRQVLPDLCRLISGQGQKPETSQVLFDQYVTGGVGQIKLGLIYDAQYLPSKDGHGPKLPENATLLYPKPTVYSRHTLVPVGANGLRVGQALKEDPELRRLAVEYGFRIEGQTGSELPQPVDVIEAPSDEMLQKMLDAVSPDSPNGQCPK